MNHKLSSLVFLFLMVFSLFGFWGIQNTEAQIVTFPPGCSSALGYSVTTGLPCSGSANVIAKFMPGCTTALGYSVTTGLPCSGASVALFWLAGCTSTVGYSRIDGAPCNGTAIATPVVVVPPVVTVAPGLPTTGASGNALWNIMLLLVSGAITALGVVYMIRLSRYERK